MAQTTYFQSHWFTEILGWLVTALGAPFWFDTLTRIMNIRAAGVVPPKATDKANSSDA